MDFNASGIPLQPSPVVEVWAGIDRVNQLLIDNAIVIHDCCVWLLDEIGSYRRKMSGDQVTEQIQNKDDYHMLDGLRYPVSYLTDGNLSRIVYDPIDIGKY